MKIWVKCNTCGHQECALVDGIVRMPGTCPVCGASNLNVKIGTTPPAWAAQQDREAA